MPDKDNLPLAADIADTATEAAETGQPLDVEAEARRLVEEHPEAEASEEDVQAALEEEHAAAQDDEA